MTVGERIRDRRIALGLTQEELAIKMGYSGKSTICKTETCGDNITTSKVNKYAKALNCSFAYLMGWEDNLTSEMADNVVDMLMDSKMSEYVKKLSLLNEEDREMIYSMIDRCSKK